MFPIAFEDVVLVLVLVLVLVYDHFCSLTKPLLVNDLEECFKGDGGPWKCLLMIQLFS